MLLQQITQDWLAAIKHRWTLDLSVMTQDLLQRQDCDVALHEVCLKHISCSHLWRLFRQNCDVDAQNNCHMQQR